MSRQFIPTLLVACAAVFAIYVDAAQGQESGITPSPILQITNLPDLPGASYYFGARFNVEGLLYLWDGTGVHRQSGVNIDGFTQIGEVQNNMADAGPIAFSRDGQNILLGNGDGGRAAIFNQFYHAGKIFRMDIGGQTVAGGPDATSQAVTDIDYHYDFLTLPTQSTIPGANQKFFVNYGCEDYMTDPRSLISVFDASTGVNVDIIDCIPGASAAMAADCEGNLYACIGWDKLADNTKRGLIKRFDIEDIDAAFSLGKTLTWNDGTALNPDNYNNQSGAGMFLDRRNYLFAGGDEGLTVFRPDGTSVTFNVGAGSYSSLAYNAYNDQFAVLTTDNVSRDPIIDIYRASDFIPVPEPSVIIMLAAVAVFGLCKKHQLKRFITER